jgi:hypothetical protein
MQKHVAQMNPQQKMPLPNDPMSVFGGSPQQPRTNDLPSFTPPAIDPTGNNPQSSGPQGSPPVGPQVNPMGNQNPNQMGEWARQIMGKLGGLAPTGNRMQDMMTQLMQKNQNLMPPGGQMNRDGMPPQMNPQSSGPQGGNGGAVPFGWPNGQIPQRPGFGGSMRGAMNARPMGPSGPMMQRMNNNRMIPPGYNPGGMS